MKINKYARKPFYVDGVRVSLENIDEVAEWCGGTIEDDDNGRFIQVKVHRPLTERQTRAYIGDWVLYAGSGFKVYVPKAFEKSFEKVKSLTKEQADEAGIKVPHEKNRKPVNPNRKKRGPSPKNMPPKRLGNVGKALQDAKEKLTTTDKPAVEVETKADPPSVFNVYVENPKSLADIEADRMIAEVNRLQGK